MRLLSSEKVSKVTETHQFKHFIRNVVKEMSSLWKDTQNQIYSQKQTRYRFFSINFLKGVEIFKYFLAQSTKKESTLHERARASLLTW